MSLPGSIDQTIHADTAHLWTHAELPGHYYNLFLPGVDCPEEAGQTAFVLGTHFLKSCARVMTQEGGQAELEEKLIRPHLQVGDALLFDCRILHFGLGNRSTHVWRPMLYINYHQQWFVDPKVCKGLVVDYLFVNICICSILYLFFLGRGYVHTYISLRLSSCLCVAFITCSRRFPFIDSYKMHAIIFFNILSFFPIQCQPIITELE